MDKIDFKKRLSALYSAPRGRFVTVDVPPMQFVKVDGSGDPNVAPSYTSAVAWLYFVSYGMKSAARSGLGTDYVVPPLEGLWWADDHSAFAARSKHVWHWTMMIMVPDFIGRQTYEAALSKARDKLGQPPGSLRLEPLAEGLCLQALHVGSYDEEGPLLAVLHDEIMPAKGLAFAGPHHEIYLSDPRRTRAARLKTILRQPVTASAAGDGRSQS